MAIVRLKNIKKSYGSLQVVHGIDLEIADGEFTVLLGPSGCGKSTTLRMIAGLEDITDGIIEIGDRVVNNVRAKDRGIAMVFQNYALYPHKTVKQNMAFGLKLAKLPKTEIERKVSEVAGILELEPLLDRKPGQLSGGQRQRVAMGRAMVRTPEVFLFDEPLSNLDAKLRAHMRLELRQLHQQLKTTTIYVTHDQVEAMTLADRIVIMRDGYIEQIGTPREVFRKPNSIFVATFIGSPSMNMIEMTVEKNNNNLVFTAEGLSLRPPEQDKQYYQSGQQIVVGIRPNDVVVSETDLVDTVAKASVQVAELLGANAVLALKAGTHDLTAEVDGADTYEAGQVVNLSVDSNALHVFERETGRRIN